MPLPTKLGALITAMGTDYKAIKTWIFGSLSGSLADLNTTNKTSIVAAINEARLPDTVEIGGVVSSKTYYEKYPDGRLICAGSHQFPSNSGAVQSYTWNFPVAFVGREPGISFISITTVPQNIDLSIGTPSLTSVVVRLYRSTSSSTDVIFQAEGRWK